MYQPDPGPLPARRIPGGHVGLPVWRHPSRAHWTDDPRLTPGEGSTPAQRWRVIVACDACALAGLAAGILLTLALARLRATTGSARASASSRAAKARPQPQTAALGVW